MVWLIGWGSVVSSVVLPVVLFWIYGKADDLPAWLQAGGAIVALVVAILVPWVQHRASDRERETESRRKARSLALACMADLEAAQGQIEVAYQTMEREVKFEPSDALEFHANQINITPLQTTRRLLESLYLLGPTGDRIQDLLGKLERYGRAYGKYAIGLDTRGAIVGLSRAEAMTLMDRLHEMIPIVKEACDEINQLVGD